MSKKIITSSSSLSLPSHIAPSTTLPNVVGLKPCGSQVLIEFLTQQEMANTVIAVSEKRDVNIPLQGYIRGVGPGFKFEDWGVSIGDRVLFSGSGIVAPNYDSIERERFIAEPHSIKCVLVEE